MFIIYSATHTMMAPHGTVIAWGVAYMMHISNNLNLASSWARCSKGTRHPPAVDCVLGGVGGTGAAAAGSGRHRCAPPACRHSWLLLCLPALHSNPAWQEPSALVPLRSPLSAALVPLLSSPSFFR